MTGLIITGSLAGVALGYVFQRSDLCFHSTWRGVIERRYHLFKIWILGVALAAVGLSVVFASDVWALNEGLGFSAVSPSAWRPPAPGSWQGSAEHRSVRAPWARLPAS